MQLFSIERVINMKKDFINIVQKCICVDFLLNALINSNSYEYMNFLSTMKCENQRNIKIMVYLYEYSHVDTINLENIRPVKVDKPCSDYFGLLLEYYFEIIESLKTLKKSSNNRLCHQLLNSLITSYFNFISLINCFYSSSSKNLSQTKVQREIKDISFSLNSNYIDIDSLNKNFVDESNIENLTYELIREMCINTIDMFFNYKLDDTLIANEHYEIFFGNNPENKFYQLFFKSNERSFKVRVREKKSQIFYLYQTIADSAQVVPHISKEEAQNYSNDYLSKKLGDKFNNLVFDDNYLNIYSYMNIPESYKFKYNIIDSNRNTIKNLYITIDSKHIYVQEIYLL